MKKLFIPFVCLVLCVASCKKEEKQEENLSTFPETEVVDHHNSQNSLDWAGTYVGTLPCADCPGIKTTIILFDSGEFELEEEYLERSFTRQDKGIFEWNTSGDTIVLYGENDKTARAFKVGENQIIHLNIEGNEITGNLANAYILKKE
jgi:uncharacterized lipoprotein NlpE involved in copper resistance